MPQGGIRVTSSAATPTRKLPRSQSSTACSPPSASTPMDRAGARIDTSDPDRDCSALTRTSCSRGTSAETATAEAGLCTASHTPRSALAAYITGTRRRPRPASVISPRLTAAARLSASSIRRFLSRLSTTGPITGDTSTIGSRWHTDSSAVVPTVPCC